MKSSIDIKTYEGDRNSQGDSFSKVSTEYKVCTTFAYRPSRILPKYMQIGSYFLTFNFSATWIDILNKLTLSYKQ